MLRRKTNLLRKLGMFKVIEAVGQKRVFWAQQWTIPQKSVSRAIFIKLGVVYGRSVLQIMRKFEIAASSAQEVTNL